jgi:RNA polymerase sigma-70 factor (ECF subfamily)
VLQIQKGNSEALGHLYDEASGLVFSVAFKILANRADAEEVTLDVFTQVWKNPSSWDAGRGSATAWLVLMARSRALDRLRWLKSRSGPGEVPEIILATLPSAEHNAETAAEANQQQARIQGALAQLSSEQKQALELAFYSGLTHQEISDQLGEPLGTIKSRIRAAMIKLKESLKGEAWTPK